MEKDNVLHDMATFDFNSSTNVTNIIFEDSNDGESEKDFELQHSIKNDHGRQNEKIYEANNCNVSINAIDQKPNVSELQNYSETTKLNNNIENNSLKRKINTTLNFSVVSNDEKCQRDTIVNNISDTRQNIYFQNATKIKKCSSYDSNTKKSVGGEKAIQLNEEEFELLWSTTKKSLLNISAHIIIVVKSYNEYRRILKHQNSTVHEIKIAENSYLLMKKLCFKFIYCTTISVLVPQEHNDEFIYDVINTTLKIANTNKETYSSYEQIQILFQELIEWAKQQNELNNLTESKKNKIEQNKQAESTKITEDIQIHPSSPIAYSVTQKTCLPSIESASTTNDKNILIISHLNNTNNSCLEILSNDKAKDNYQKSETRQQSPEPIVNSCFFPLSSHKNTAEHNQNNLNEKQQFTETSNSNVNPKFQTQTLQNVNSEIQSSFTQNTKLNNVSNSNLEPIVDPSYNIVINNIQKHYSFNQQCNFIPNIVIQPLFKNSTDLNNSNQSNQYTNNAIQNFPRNISHPSTIDNQCISYHKDYIMACGCRLGRDWRKLRYIMTVAEKNYNPHYSYAERIASYRNPPISQNTRPPPPPYPTFKPTNFVDNRNWNSNHQTLSIQNSSDYYQKGHQHGSLEMLIQTNAIDTSRSTSSRDSGIGSPTFATPTSTHNILYQENSCPTPIITHTTSLNPNVSQISEGKCYNCTKSCRLKCIGCYKVYYCSYDCQKYDWDNHKKICREETYRQRQEHPIANFY